MVEKSNTYLAQMMQYCAYQERCHDEVRYKLVQIGARGQELEDIISKLITEDFLNEERFAASYVRGKFRHNGWGRQKIIQHLKQKGVSSYCIKHGLKEITATDYKAMIRTLILKKNDTIPKSDNFWTRKQKILRYLAQRGFEADDIYEQINELATDLDCS